MAIYELKNYGFVRINLKQVMKNKNITRTKLSKLSNTDYSVINRYYKGNVARIDLDVLARICYILECDIEDILKYDIK